MYPDCAKVFFSWGMDDASEENALDFKIQLVQCLTQLKAAQKVGREPSDTISLGRP